MEDGDLRVYTIFLDIDEDTETGGKPNVLGFNTEFEGAELIINLTVEASTSSIITWELWKYSSTLGNFELFNCGEFCPIDTQLRTAFAQDIPDDGMDHRRFADHDDIVFSIPNSLLGADLSTPFRTQVISTFNDVFQDRMPDDTLASAGFTLKTDFPRFPTCSVSPDPVNPGEVARFLASGLIPNRVVKVFPGETGENGAANLQLCMPSDIGGGR